MSIAGVTTTVSIGSLGLATPPIHRGSKRVSVPRHTRTIGYQIARLPPIEKVGKAIASRRKHPARPLRVVHLGLNLMRPAAICLLNQNGSHVACDPILLIRVVLRAVQHDVLSVRSELKHNGHLGKR